MLFWRQMFEVSTAGKFATAAAAAVLSQRDRVTSLRGEEVGAVCLSVAMKRWICFVW